MNKALLRFLGIEAIILTAGITAINTGSTLDYIFAFLTLSLAIIILVGYIIGRKKSIFYQHITIRVLMASNAQSEPGVDETGFGSVIDQTSYLFQRFFSLFQS